MGRYAHFLNDDGDLCHIAVHPGCTLEEYIAANVQSEERFADDCRLPLSMIWRVCHGTQDIDPRIATSLSRGTGIDASFWTNLQSHYNEELTEGISAGYKPTYLYISDLGGGNDQ